MNLSSENYKDISKYFKDCFVKYPDEAGDKLFFVEKIGADAIRGTHLSEESGEQEPYIFHLLSEKEEGFKSINAEFLLPKKSYFMHEKEAHLLYRKPLRQYRRGICEDNTAIVRLRADGSFHNAGVNWHVLKSYVEKTTFSGFDLTGTLPSYALSPRMAVCRAGLIYVDRIKIGTYNYKTRNIVLKNDMFLPEISTIVGVHQQNIIITVGKPTEEEVL